MLQLAEGDQPVSHAIPTLNDAGYAGNSPHLSTGFFPDAATRGLRDNARMVENPEIVSRIAEKLVEQNLTERDASIKVTGKPDMIRDIKRGRMPSAPRMKALADLLNTTTDWILKGGDRAGSRTAEPSDQVAERGLPFRPYELPRDVPVYGTALGHDISSNSEDRPITVETTTFEIGDVVDWLRRPPSLSGRRDIYGLYVVGYSMAPRFEPGDPVYVDPRRPPSIGDYVIVQVRKNHEDNDEIVTALIKRLARRSGSYIELEQFEPRGTFKIEMSEVASIHRVLSVADLMAV